MSFSHACRNSVKTDAPNSVIWVGMNQKYLVKFSSIVNTQISEVSSCYFHYLEISFS